MIICQLGFEDVKGVVSHFILRWTLKRYMLEVGVESFSQKKKKIIFR